MFYYPLTANSWGQEEIDAIHRVIASDRFTKGPHVEEFEEAFARYHDRKFAVMVNSGSSANLLAVAAMSFHGNRPLQRGDEVIVPAISWSTTFHPLQQYGLRLRFVDVDLETLNMDVGQLEKALTPATRAVVGVSILGNPARLDVMRDFAERHGLWFFEDNCESLDARLDGRLTGAFGHISTFSFFFSHHISTMEGGMVLTDDEELFFLLRALRAHGWTRDVPPGSPYFERKSTDFYEAYRFILPGYNVRPLEMSGAVGTEQLRKLPAMTALRRRNLALFQELFANDPHFLIQRETGVSSAFSFTLIVRPETGLDRTRALEALHEASIEFRIITGGNFLRHDVIRHYDYEVVGGAAPNADIAHDRGFFVGNHPHDLRPQIERLREVLNSVY
ncbi:MAG: DegT/DnrJ/EryC1/StrS family aminotransferase [Alphaproteobacteria bacterium]